MRAIGRDEARALLHDWRAALGDSTPDRAMAAAFALCGDTRTALELMSRAKSTSVPMAQSMNELTWALLASAQGQFDEAKRHLATLTSLVRDHAIPGGQVDCLLGFAKVALDRGDYIRASRILAAVIATADLEGRPRGSITLDGLVYVHCTAVLREVLDPESLRIAQADGAGLSLKEVLDAELSRERAPWPIQRTDQATR